MRDEVLVAPKVRYGVEPIRAPPPWRASGIGAHRKHESLPTDFRLLPENGPSRYGHRTARFAPISAVEARPDSTKRGRSQILGGPPSITRRAGWPAASGTL